MKILPAFTVLRKVNDLLSHFLEYSLIFEFSNLTSWTTFVSVILNEYKSIMIYICTVPVETGHVSYVCKTLKSSSGNTLYLQACFLEAMKPNSSCLPPLPLFFFFCFCFYFLISTSISNSNKWIWKMLMSVLLCC